MKTRVWAVTLALVGSSGIASAGRLSDSPATPTPSPYMAPTPYTMPNPYTAATTMPSAGAAPAAAGSPVPAPIDSLVGEVLATISATIANDEIDDCVPTGKVERLIADFNLLEQEREAAAARIDGLRQEWKGISDSVDAMEKLEVAMEAALVALRNRQAPAEKLAAATLAFNQLREIFLEISSEAGFADNVIGIANTQANDVSDDIQEGRDALNACAIAEAEMSLSGGSHLMELLTEECDEADRSLRLASGKTPVFYSKRADLLEILGN